MGLVEVGVSRMGGWGINFELHSQQVLSIDSCL